VNTGKVRFVFRDFAFLGAESDAAANAAQCAEDQNKLWAYHDALYTAKVADDAKGGSEDDGFLLDGGVAQARPASHWA
jgi:protein-disulfide isomerase